MSTRPRYYEDIDKRFEGIELQLSRQDDRQREFRQSMDDTLVHIAEIHHLLAGTEYDKDKNGGLVGRICRVEGEVTKNTNFRQRAIGIATIVSVIFSGAVAWVISHLKTGQ